MCTGATVANLKHTHKSTSGCCFRLAKIHEHLRDRSWSFTNRTYTVRSGKGQKEFESKSFKITVISMFHPFLPTLWHHCATQITPAHPHPSPTFPPLRARRRRRIGVAFCRGARIGTWAWNLETKLFHIAEGMTVAREDWASSQECNTDYMDTQWEASAKTTPGIYIDISQHDNKIMSDATCWHKRAPSCECPADLPIAGSLPHRPAKPSIFHSYPPEN